LGPGGGFLAFVFVVLVVFLVGFVVFVVFFVVAVVFLLFPSFVSHMDVYRDLVIHGHVNTQGVILLFLLFVMHTTKGVGSCNRGDKCGGYDG